MLLLCCPNNCLVLYHTISPTSTTWSLHVEQKVSNRRGWCSSVPGKTNAQSTTSMLPQLLWSTTAARLEMESCVFVCAYICTCTCERQRESVCVCVWMCIRVCVCENNDNKWHSWCASPIKEQDTTRRIQQQITIEDISTPMHPMLTWKNLKRPSPYQDWESRLY